MTEEPTIADNFLATAQALGLDPRLRREALDKLREANDRMDADRENGSAER